MKSRTPMKAQAPRDHSSSSQILVAPRSKLSRRPGNIGSSWLSVELIRRQYRLLSDRFAPEKFATHGPEFVEMAADKRDRAERAARHLLAGYNEPLEAPAAPSPPADLRHNPDLDDVFGG